MLEMAIIVTLVVSLAVGAPKPANIADLAGSYARLNGSLTFCTRTLLLETSGDELTAIKVEDYPLKCDLPRAFQAYEYSSARGTQVAPKSRLRRNEEAAATDRVLVCSGRRLITSLFRALRDHPLDDWGEPLPLRKGVLYLVFFDQQVHKGCLYQANAGSQEPSVNSYGGTIVTKDPQNGRSSSAEGTPGDEKGRNTTATTTARGDEPWN